MRGYGMTTGEIASYINRQKLYVRHDGKPVTSAQVYATMRRYPAIFIYDRGLFWVQL